ncbi:MAG TPA: BlaI/MecI/CopY family transcriptional regulator [Pyrinomonadaceae bacterium]|nr:BlaI/MecI/CopY family transcriptional regulator [Pyrinomonadaceae bacterium]
MANAEPVKLTRLELEIMGAVWALGSASVREIQEQLPERKRPAYTTVQTIVYRLEEKGAVRRTKKVGNAHIFEAVVTRKAAHSRLIDELLNVFGGSPRSLMAQLVETGRLTLEDIRHLETTLASLEAKKIHRGSPDLEPNSSQHADKDSGKAPAKRRERSAG